MEQHTIHMQAVNGGKVRADQLQQHAVVINEHGHLAELEEAEFVNDKQPGSRIKLTFIIRFAMPDTSGAVYSILTSRDQLFDTVKVLVNP